ncbi:two-component sensor histidine kinase [Asanoa ishikariensis]|uniref:histidine kinase n=1 Tax=Asanoa ishikariensis TaxID=137265 RepID=A0A1H3R700_9ACTN|nr:HAMP domain-containing sensor histidine kinase [Asanoa ishikariensis]GIF64337.1 two-component sensor histidine kinase [Asanoa ishikariensis]SDZ21554.1 two-component system, OmpR family, sensor histidine kinase MtrB [Asanoa ishikariensis]
MTRWGLGLRGRLLLAFAMLGLTTTALVAGVSYGQARTVVLQKAQDAAVLSLVDEVTRLDPVRELPPSPEQLNAIVAALAEGPDAAAVLYRDGYASSGLHPSEIPQPLRAEVRDGRVVWQRFSRDGTPTLAIGTQLRTKRPDGSTEPTGIEVYRLHPLADEQHSIDQLAALAWSTGAASLVLAVLLALLAARGVLRPVSELGRAARRLGEGDLKTRATVHGSDELAGVALIFNQTAERLERQVGELRRMEADARRFVADVSHELRTPLAAMTAVTDVLDEEAERLPGDAGKAARLVSQETQNLAQLVEDLIEISRFDAGTAALACDDIDVGAAIRATLRSRGWTDQVTIALPDRVLAWLDPRRLDVIVANLVGNALRHGAAPVTVDLRAVDGWVEVTVSDYGPGLTPEVRDHVFDRFYKADSARSRSEGAGLGLAIALENARLHGGTLVAGNRSPHGAVFSLRVPRGGTA